MPVRIVICKARRAGLSTGVESLIYDDSTTTPNTYSLIVANEKNPSENILQMCRVFWKHTPEYFDVPGHGRIMIRPPLPPQFNNNPPKDRIEFDEPLSSRIFVATARSIDAYLGYGFQNMHATEAAYYADGHELFRALYPTLSTDAHSALYIESTPNGQEGRGRWFYEQCLSADTQVLTKRGFVGPDEIRDDDEVAAFSLAESSIEWRPITGRVDRALGPCEAMYELRGQGTDIRVTGGHRMVYRRPGSLQWQVATAEELAKRRSPYIIPAAHYPIERSGLDLTDDEIRFIGWFLTDGHRHKTNGQVTIYQAEDSPFNAAIVSCLEGCGFKYSVSRSAGTSSQFKRNSPMIRYGVPRGVTRRVGDKRGWNTLDAYLDKDFSPLLDGLSTLQLGLLLEAMHMGDGEKQRSKRFTQRSYHIGTGRQCVAERLQSLCIRRGWRASLSVRKSPLGSDYWTVRVKDEAHRSVSPPNKRGRPFLKRAEPEPDERVWCVSNDLQTLVIRRNGKTAIVGNCMDAHARKRTEHGEMRLVFIPWHEMTHSFSIPFRSQEAKAAFTRSLTESEKDLVRRFNVSMEQLQWRRMILAGPTFNRDEDMFMQEYPEDLATAFLMSGTSVFGRKHIKRLMANTRHPEWEGDIYWGESDEKNEREPIHELVRRPRFLTKGQARAAGFEPHTNERTYNNLKVYRWPQKDERIFICADVGEGNPETKDGDFSTICVGVLNELGRDEVIMTWRGHLNPLSFGEVCAALSWGIRYRVGEGVVAPELAVEWNGPGKGCCTYIDTKNLYPKTYRYQPIGVHGLPSTKHIGWESNAKTKPIMVSYTLRMIERDLIDVPDEDLVLEMASYRQLDSFGDEGSFGGASGRHDDMVSAFQILCVLLRLRSQTIPGEADVEEVNMLDDDGDQDLPPFDPFAGEIPILGGTASDFDEDSAWEVDRW